MKRNTLRRNLTVRIAVPAWMFLTLLALVTSLLWLSDFGGNLPWVVPVENLVIGASNTLMLIIIVLVRRERRAA